MATTGCSFELVSFPHSRSTGPRQIAGWPQVNHDLHLVHTVAGRGALRVGGKIYPTHTGNVLAVPMRQNCLWDKPDDADWVMINLHYRITLADGDAMEDRYEIPTVFRPANLARIHRLLRNWHGRWEEGGIMQRLTVAADLHTLAAGYWSAHAVPMARPRPRDEAMIRVRTLIDQHPELPFDADRLASHAGISTSQMNRRFRAATGFSPQVYWQHQRAALCRRALRERTETLEELAPILGFSDVYYFSRWFRKQTGATPGQYRRQSRSLTI